MSEWWRDDPQLTPRQRDVQAAHHTGFWSGFWRGASIGAVILLPFWVAFLVWHWL